VRDIKRRQPWTQTREILRWKRVAGKTGHTWIEIRVLCTRNKDSKNRKGSFRDVTWRSLVGMWRMFRTWSYLLTFHRHTHTRCFFHTYNWCPRVVCMCLCLCLCLCHGLKCRKGQYRMVELYVWLTMWTEVVETFTLNTSSISGSRIFGVSFSVRGSVVTERTLYHGISVKSRRKLALQISAFRDLALWLYVYL